MKRLIAGLLVALALPLANAVFDAPPAGACSCVRFNDRDAFERADAVFIGKVIGYEAPATLSSSVDPALWTFAVSQVLKGEVTRTQQVVSQVSGASCGLEIPRSGEFLVFASVRTSGLSPAPAVGQFYAGLCGGTRAISEGVLDAGLASPHAPVRTAVAPPSTRRARAVDGESSLDASVVWIVGATAVGSLGLGLVLLVLRRRRVAPRRGEWA